MAKKKVFQCGNCLFGQDSGIKRFNEPLIACQRFPPTQEGRQQTSDPYPFPMVKETLWCGEYKPQKEHEDGKEEKTS